MDFTLQQLKVFLAVVEGQSVSQAAKALQLRQSTVSFHLQSLEAAVGVALIIRGRQRWELTSAGSELLRYAKTLTTTAQEAARVMTDLRTARQRRLLIGTSRVPGTFIVPSAVQQFHAKFPEIQIEVESMPSPMVRRRVEDRQLDIGFIIDAKPVKAPMESILVMEDEIGCVFSSNTGLQWIKGPIEPQQLQAIPLIGHATESSTAQVCKEWAEKQNVTLKNTVVLGSIDMMKTAVKHGMGAALLSRLIVYDEMKTGELLYAPLAQAPRRQLRLIYHRALEYERLQEFIEIVGQTAAPVGH